MSAHKRPGIKREAEAGAAPLSDGERLLDDITKLARGKGNAIDATRSCNELSAFLAGTLGGYAELIAGGGHFSLLMVMRHHRARLGAVVAAMQCLRLACGAPLDDPAPVSLSSPRSEGWAHDFVVTAARAAVEVMHLYPASSALQGHGCTMLGFLCGSAASREAVAVAGAREACLAALRRHGLADRDVAMGALHTLTLLSFPMREHTAGDALLADAMPVSSPRLQAEADAIWASDAPELALAVLRACAPRGDVMLARRAHYACTLLVNLSARPGAHERLLALGAADALIRALPFNCHSPATYAAAAMALHNVVSAVAASSPAVARSFMLGEPMGYAAALAGIKPSYASHPDAATAACCLFRLSLAYEALDAGTSTAVLDTYMMEGAVSFCARALRAFSSVPRLALQAAAALSLACTRSKHFHDSKRQSQRSDFLRDAIPGAVAALHSLKCSRDAADAAVHLATILLDEYVQASEPAAVYGLVAPAAVVDALVHAAEVHGKDAAAASHIVAVLYHLCCEDGAKGQRLPVAVAGSLLADGQDSAADHLRTHPRAGPALAYALKEHGQDKHQVQLAQQCCALLHLWLDDGEFADVLSLGAKTIAEPCRSLARAVLGELASMGRAAETAGADGGSAEHGSQLLCRILQMAEGAQKQPGVTDPGFRSSTAARDCLSAAEMVMRAYPESASVAAAGLCLLQFLAEKKCGSLFGWELISDRLLPLLRHHHRNATVVSECLRTLLQCRHLWAAFFRSSSPAGAGMMQLIACTEDVLRWHLAQSSASHVAFRAALSACTVLARICSLMQADDGSAAATSDRELGLYFRCLAAVVEALEKWSSASETASRRDSAFAAASIVDSALSAGAALPVPLLERLVDAELSAIFLQLRNDDHSTFDSAGFQACRLLRSIASQPQSRPLLMERGAAEAMVTGLALVPKVVGRVQRRVQAASESDHPPPILCDSDLPAEWRSGAYVFGSRAAMMMDNVAVACGVLRNLCASPEHRLAVAAAGAGPALVAFLACHNDFPAPDALYRYFNADAFVWPAVGALFGLACEPISCRGLLDAGAAAAVCLAAAQRPSADSKYTLLHHAPTAWVACGLILKMATALSAPAQLSPSTAAAHSACSGASVGDGSRRDACTGGSCPLAHLVLEDGAGELLAAALHLHEGDSRVTRAARAAAAALASCPAARSVLQGNDGLLPRADAGATASAGAAAADVHSSARSADATL